MDIAATPPAALQGDEARAAVETAARRHFAACRERVGPFVDRHFGLAGSLRLHRHAVGWDLLRAPANVFLSVPQVSLKLGGWALSSAGARGLGERLRRRNLFLETAVARELRWLIVTELLEQPMADGDRITARDGLAEAILAEPEVEALLAAAGAEAAAHRDDPAFRARLEAAIADYAGTRAAASEIATGLVTLGAGAVAFSRATPGMIALGPLLAGSLAQSAAVASFPLGATAGGIWYGMFPAAATPALVAGTTAGLMGVAAVGTAFAGVLADPVQRALGLHRRRLLRLVDTVERQFLGDGTAGFTARDLYVARLMDLSDLLFGIARGLRG